MSAMPPLMEFIGGLAAMGAVWFGVQEIQNQRTHDRACSRSSSPTAFMMYGPIKKLSRVNASIQQAIAASERIFAMLDTHTRGASRNRRRAGACRGCSRSVEFRRRRLCVRRSRRDRFVLRHASVQVRAGQVVAIVGLSGAGKTTLVNLIPRFYDVTEGRSSIDGVDIRDVTLGSLRESDRARDAGDRAFRRHASPPTSPTARPSASREAIEAAARAAHAHEFIRPLPGGYDAHIGERGQRLSGGQRQRLAIARALLKDCPLLVLDEATSSLDAESEQLVQDALANLMRNRTTFVIAHRLSTVRRADLIIALEDGRIAEIGTHDELLARPDGVYAKLYALQAFQEPDVGPWIGSEKRCRRDSIDDRVRLRRTDSGGRNGARSP